MTDLVSQLVGALELCQRALQSQWSPYLRAGDKEAAAMKAAASALTAAKAGEWLPIETAPKDGRRVLVFAPLDGVLSSHFDGGMWQNIPWRRGGAKVGQPSPAFAAVRAERASMRA